MRQVHLWIAAIVILLVLAVLAVFLSPRRLKRKTLQEEIETPTFLSTNSSFSLTFSDSGSFLTALLFLSSSLVFLTLAAYLFWSGFAEYMHDPSHVSSLRIIAVVALLPSVLGTVG